MTIDPNTAVGDIAAALPQARSVFDRYGIDYCCGGRRSLAAACAERGLAVEKVAAELATSPAPARPVPPFETLAELVDHIVSTHHTFTRAELGRLVPLVAKVERAHGAKHAELTRVRELTEELAADLGPHLAKEERILFPYLVALEASATRPAAPFATIAQPVAVMRGDHENVAHLLRALRGATGAYAVPDDACASYRALYEGLAALDQDLIEHIHLENNVAFPRAEQLENSLAVPLSPNGNVARASSAKLTSS